MASILELLVSSDSFIPHGHCYLWRPGLVWLHLLSDTAIALAYYSIPLTLIYFVEQRKDLPFNWIFLLFCGFIVACGTTHLMEVWTLWHPTYWLSGTLKAATAAVSVFTAVRLFGIMPQALALPSPAQLETANRALHSQIAERLSVEAELKRYQSELEQIVADRTAQLADSNRQMEELLRREQEARSQAETAKAEIQRYADRLTLAMDAAKMGSWEWDTQSDEVVATPQLELMLGLTPGEQPLTRTLWRSRVHPEDLPEVVEASQRAIATGTDFDHEYRLLLPNGSLRWVQAVGSCQYDTAGRPYQMAGVLIDISNRKCAEESLRQSEETARQQLAEIEAIYATAPIGLCVIDSQLRYVRINEFLANQINGIPVEAHLGRTVSEVLPKLASYQEQLFRQVMETGLPLLNVEVVGTTPAQPDVERVWLAGYYPLQGVDGTVRAINMTVQEITERKQSEKVLQERAQEMLRLNAILHQTTLLLKERNQELDQFAYIVSHDLKAPLRAIANLSTWIEDDLTGQLPQEAEYNLNLLRSRVLRMESLINGLLTYSRVGRTEAAIAEVNVQTLLEEVIDLLDPPAEVTLEVAPNMPVLTTKPLLLSQVFSNLISNAIKHRDRPTALIQISVCDRGEAYEFAITDDGPGIDPRYHDKIFTIFQTLKSRDEQESTGIGLSIVKKIVENEGGSIWVESKEGNGATFRFLWQKQPVDNA